MLDVALLIVLQNAIESHGFLHRWDTQSHSSRDRADASTAESASSILLTVCLLRHISVGDTVPPTAVGAITPHSQCGVCGDSHPVSRGDTPK